MLLGHAEIQDTAVFRTCHHTHFFSVIQSNPKPNQRKFFFKCYKKNSECFLKIYQTYGRFQNLIRISKQQHPERHFPRFFCNTKFYESSGYFIIISCRRPYCSSFLTALYDNNHDNVQNKTSAVCCQKSDASLKSQFQNGNENGNVNSARTQQQIAEFLGKFS